MSGAELALALLPILISAVEHYSDCFRPLRRYHKFTSEIDHFLQRLKIQRAIFRNQCRILLLNAVDQDVASHMLEERDHPSWSDADTEKVLIEQLGSSREACIAAIGLIDESLCDIARKIRGLGTIVDQEYQVMALFLYSIW